MVLALMVGTTLFSACKKTPKYPQLERLEVASNLTKDFAKLAPTLYEEGAQLPELMNTFHSKYYSFMLRAEDEDELDRLRGPISKLLQKHKVDRIVIVLIGSKVMVGGKEYHQDERNYIMGAYDIDDKGGMTRRESTIEAMEPSSIESFEGKLNASPKK